MIESFELLALIFLTLKELFNDVYFYKNDCTLYNKD